MFIQKKAFLSMKILQLGIIEKALLRLQYQKDYVMQNVKIEYQRNISEKVHLCQRIRTLLIQKDFLDMVQ